MPPLSGRSKARTPLSGKEVLGSPKTRTEEKELSVPGWKRGTERAGNC